MTEDGRVVIARIPKGQSLELVAAVAAFFGAVVPEALMSQGDDFGTAADITTSTATSERDVVVALRRATRKLTKGMPAAVAADEPDDTFVDDPMVLNQLRRTDGGVEFGIGGATEAARQLVGELLA